MDSNTFQIFTDGGARGNPGPAASAFVAIEKGKLNFSQTKYLGVATNNIAEYEGVILALKWLEKNKKNIKFNEINFFLDSELVTKQLQGKFKIKNENLRSLFYSIKKLENSIGKKINCSHIPRSKNKIADLLVNQCLDKNI